MKIFRCPHCKGATGYFSKRQYTEKKVFDSDHYNVDTEVDEKETTLRYHCRDCNREVTETVEESRPKCRTEGWSRDKCQYDEKGVCIHCGGEIPF